MSKVDLIKQGKLRHQRLIVVKEVLSEEVSEYDIAGVIDGENTVFYTSFDYKPGKLKVYKNGMRMKPGSSNDYTETGANQFSFIDPPLPGDEIVADYFLKNTE